MKNPSWWEDPPEDPPEENPDQDDLNWDTPNHAPFQDRDCDYWRRLFSNRSEDQ